MSEDWLMWVLIGFGVAVAIIGVTAYMRMVAAPPFDKKKQPPDETNNSHK